MRRRARAARGKRSPSSDVDAGEQVASPTPTPRRRRSVARSCARGRTPRSAGSRRRRRRSESAALVLSDNRPSGRPKTAYSSVNTVPSSPSAVSLRPHSRRMPSPTAADDLAVEEVHEVDREQHDERVARAGGHAIMSAFLEPLHRLRKDPFSQNRGLGNPRRAAMVSTPGLCEPGEPGSRQARRPCVARRPAPPTTCFAAWAIPIGGLVA